MKANNPYQIINTAGKAFIRIVGEISFWKNSSEQFTSAIDTLVGSGVKDVELYMNCAGGSMFEANEIANQISRFTGKKTARLGAIAASAASYLMTYFDTVIAAGNTQVMLHDPIQTLKVEHPEDFDSAKKLYENLRNIAIDRYSEKMGVSKEKVSQMMRVTTWLSAKEAKAKGLVDEVNEELKIKNEERSVQQTGILLQSSPVNCQLKQSDMTAIIKALSLAEDATEVQVVEAINQLKDTAVKAVSELASSKGLTSEAISKLAGSDLENTLEMVLETQATSDQSTTMVNTVVQTIENTLKGGQQPTKKSFDHYTPQELEMMADQEPEKYEQLINELIKN